MEIKVFRDIYTDNSTTSQIHIDGGWVCYGLELPTPQEGTPHIKGNCCVPLGKYSVTLRKEGSVWGWMLPANPGIGLENGIPWIKNIPGNNYPVWIEAKGILPEQYVLIHDGNSPHDTLGCLLTGLQRGTDCLLSGTSAAAFQKVYPQLLLATKNNDTITIEYIDARV